MLCIINYKIDIVDIFTLIISIFALVATLRKKEFGKLYFVVKNKNNDDLWIRSIKSDLYELKITCEPYTNMSCRINLRYENEDKDSVLAFLSETEPIIQKASLKANTTIKIRGCNSSKIHIEYKDKYNNHYVQELTQEKISKRRQINIWNLTFVGT